MTEDEEVINSVKRILKELISKKTVNLPGDEHLTRPFVEKCLKELNMNIEVIEKEENRPNIIGKLVLGEGPSIAIVTHMDVVPAGDGWNTDPFELTEKNGKLYGRGVVDNKGPFALSYEAIKKALKKGLNKGTIYFLAVADEERGSEKGMIYLLEQGFKSDYAFIPDGGSLNEIVVGEKGSLWLEIESLGLQAHSSTPKEGINAITNICELINEINKITNWGKFDSRFDNVTLNVGHISGGTAPNMVPHTAKTILDIRYPDGLTKQNILNKINLAIELTTSKIPFAKFNITEIESINPHILEKDHKIINTFLESSKKNNFDIDVVTCGGITVAKNFYSKGIPCVVHYPCGKDDKVIHMANEYLSIDKINPIVNLWSDFIYDVLME
jgi:succinyl-diaminopimelate desuccinylase